MIGAFERLLGWLTAVAAIALAVMVLLVVAGTVPADLLHRPIGDIFSPGKSLLAVIVFLGLPRVIFSEGNIIVEIVDRFIGRRAIILLRASSGLLSAIYLGLLLWHMLTPAHDAFVFGHARNDLGTPVYFIWIPVLFGMATSLISALVIAFRQLSKAFRTEKK